MAVRRLSLAGLARAANSSMMAVLFELKPFQSSRHNPLYSFALDSSRYNTSSFTSLDSVTDRVSADEDGRKPLCSVKQTRHAGYCNDGIKTTKLVLKCSCSSSHSTLCFHPIHPPAHTHWPGGLTDLD